MADDIRRPVSVLIVARSTYLRDGLGSLLSVSPRFGRIEYATDGPSALKAVESGCPDLVLLDFDLPFEDVTVVIREIKSCCPATPCLAFTDYVDKSEEIRMAGADRVLLKGYPATELIDTIAELLP